MNGDAIPNGGDAYLSTVQTDTNGSYHFSVDQNGTYFVVVDSKTLSAAAGVWMEQTDAPKGGLCDRNGTTVVLDSVGACYGGRDATRDDDASSLDTAEHIVRVDLNDTNASAVDFGFSPDVVTRVSDAGQGTLRQFILNANALSGPNVMHFVPMRAPNATHWWTIQLHSPLPVFTDAGTVLDGSAYAEDGSVRDTNAGQGAHSLEAVGTGPDALEGTGDETHLPQFAYPELEIDMNDQFNTQSAALGYIPKYDENVSGVFVIDADDTQISHLALYNAAYGDDEKSVDVHPAILIKGGSNVLVTDNFIGLRADGTEPASGAYVKNGVMQLNGAISAIARNEIGSILYTGVWAGNNSFIYENALTKAAMMPTADAISTELSSGDRIRIESNRIEGASGYGIESFNSPSVVTIIGNTLLANGQDSSVANKNERGAIRIFGMGNVIEHNVLHDHPGNGIVVTGGQTDNRITQNAIYHNGGLSIDLDLGSSDYNGDGITANDGLLEANRSNRGMDTPVITTATIDGSTLHIAGYVGSDHNQTAFAQSTIEVYKVDDDGDGYGEGRWYLGSCSADTNAHFDCNLTTSLVADSDIVSATATDTDGDTSEFGPNIVVSDPSKVRATCLGIFPAAVSSTSDGITLDNGVRIYNTTDHLLTTPLLSSSSNALCDGEPCVATGTSAGTLSFTVDTGSGADGTLYKSGQSVTIDTDKAYSDLKGDSGATFTLSGTIEVRSQQNFDLASNSTLIIDGDVTIYADHFELGSNTILKIVSGHLTVFANSVSLQHASDASIVPDSDDFVVLSTSDLTIGTKGILKGIFYSGNHLTVLQGNEISGALTGKLVDINPQAIIQYNEPAVHTFCGDSGKPQLSVTDASVTEGDTGTKQMSFTINLDRTLTSDVTVEYNTGEGIAEPGKMKDYVGIHKGSVTIPAGSDSVTVDVTINGDTFIEADEDFYLFISTKADLVIADNIGKGVILNDDRSLKVVAADTSQIDGNITTKVVHNPFDLKVIAYDSANNIPMPDVNITSIDLITSDGMRLDGWWSGPAVSTDTNGVATLTGLQCDRASKDTRLIIHATLYGSTYDSNTSDHFAVRPDRFVLQLPLSNIAGIPTPLRLYALDANGSNALGYAESSGISFRIGHHEHRAACHTGNLVLPNVHFSDGYAEENLTYDEVGALDLNISEIPGQEFARIDQDDTPDSARYITPATLSSAIFEPAHISVLSWDLQSPASVLYYAGSGALMQMGAKLKATVAALNASGGRVANYTQGCYASPTDLNISFDITTDSTQGQKLLWKDANSPDHTSLGNGTSIFMVGSQTGRHFLFDVNLSHFVAGEANETLMINFDRQANLPKEPMRFTVTGIGVRNGLHTPSIGASGTKQVDFYYGRLHVPDYTHVGTTYTAKVYYEVYSKSHTPDIFPLTRGVESLDAVHWYIVPTSMPGAILSAYSLNGSDVVQSFDDQSVSLRAPKLPFETKILYRPASWLRFNRWNASVTQHAFRVYFSSNVSKWAGRGKKGATLDMNVSRRRGQMKMEW